MVKKFLSCLQPSSWSRRLAASWAVNRHWYLSSTALNSCSTDNPVQDVMFDIHAVLGLPRLLEPGVVPCMISFSRLSPFFLITCPKYTSFLSLTDASKLLSTCDYNKIYHITPFMCAPYLEKSKPTFLPWFLKRSSVHVTASLSNLNRFQ